MKDGILDQEKGEYTNLVTGETMSIDDAIDRSLLVVEAGRPEDQDSDEVRSRKRTIQLKFSWTKRSQSS